MHYRQYGRKYKFINIKENKRKKKFEKLPIFEKYIVNIIIYKSAEKNKIKVMTINYYENWNT